MAKFIREEIWRHWEAELAELKKGGGEFVFRKARNNKNREVGLICVIVDGTAVPVARMIEPSDRHRYTVPKMP